jgi:hypothetical protein
MGWQPFDLDHRAHKIVLQARERDQVSLNQAYKMRSTCAYGLERFWGEHLRLKRIEPKKADFVKETWAEFVEIMQQSRPDLVIPAAVLNSLECERIIKDEASKFWRIKTSDQQECLTVLVALCDAIVWWTQRLKTKSSSRPTQDEDEAIADEDTAQ